MWDQDYGVMRATITEISAISTEITIADHPQAVADGISAFVADQKHGVPKAFVTVLDDRIVALLVYRALVKQPQLIK